VPWLAGADAVDANRASGSRSSGDTSCARCARSSFVPEEANSPTDYQAKNGNEGVGSTGVPNAGLLITDKDIELTATIAHELQHVVQINSAINKQTKAGQKLAPGLPFTIDYLAEYNANLKAGMSDFDAYRLIGIEMEGKAVQQALESLLKQPGVLDKVNALIRNVNPKTR
jgi:hypothetical protein